MNLTHKQKQALAAALLDSAGTIVEFWSRQRDLLGDDAKDITAEQAARQFAMWLKNLPGGAWDNRLPQPEKGGR